MTRREDTDRDDDKEARVQGVLRQTSSELQKVGPMLTASWQLVATILLAALIGWWLDGKLGTAPWLLIAGALFGIAAGLFSFIRAALAMGRSSGRPPNPPQPPPPPPPS